MTFCLAAAAGILHVSLLASRAGAARIMQRVCSSSQTAVAASKLLFTGDGCVASLQHTGHVVMCKGVLALLQGTPPWY